MNTFVCRVALKSYKYLSTLGSVILLAKVEKFRQTEVGDFNLIIALYQDITGCQVSVYYATSLQVLHTL